MSRKKILVTGAAGFIGFHLVRRLLADGHTVVGLDNLNDYYDVNLKYGRLEETGIPRHHLAAVKDAGAAAEGGVGMERAAEDAAGKDEKATAGGEGSTANHYSPGSGQSASETSAAPSSVRHTSVLIQSNTNDKYSFLEAGLEDRLAVEALFRDGQFDVVVNLAAQAGVRYSLENPHAYIESNINGFLNILEGCRHNRVEHLIYASSSSVYGNNTSMPFKTSDNVDHPVSLYAATKKSNELMAHTYSHLYSIPATGLRFFTVYGPWGRPDMAYFKFAELMRDGKPIDVYNFGDMSRDFTYIDDIVESIVRLIPKAQKSQVPHRLFNIGNGSPVNLMDFIQELEKGLGMEAEKNMMEMQPGDVPRTWADSEALFEVTGYRPGTGLAEGIGEFVKWYRAYYKV